MRVGFITHYPELYGANRSLLNLIDGLQKHQVTPYVISASEGQITDSLRVRGVAVEVLPIQWWVSKKPQPTNNTWKYLSQQYYAKRKAIKRLYLNLQILKDLIEKLREWEIDAIHTNSSVTPIGLLAAKQLGIPHIWHFREFGDLDYGFLPDWGSGIHKLVIRSSDACIAISKTIRNHRLTGVASQRVHIIYNGIASEEEFDRLYALSQQKSVSQKPYTFAILGFIHPGKGQEIAIKALSLVANKFPETRLLIVGGGKEADLRNLQQLAKSLQVEEKVEFWGQIADPYTAYRVADAVLMCSKNEAMGRVTVEGMSACLPVIGYDNAGTSELISHERTGLLYRGEHEELAKCMLRLVENPKWGQQIGHHGWQFARDRFTVESYAQAVYKVLLSVTEKSEP